MREARRRVSGERLFDVLDAPSPVREKFSASILRDVTGHVRFENVSFSYGDRPALYGIDLDVQAPGSRWTLRRLFRQMEAHYGEHTANVVKKFDLPDWPAE